MSLRAQAPIGFIPTTQPDAARAFYETTLGLEFVSEDAFAIVFRLGGGIMLRLVRVGSFTPLPFTLFGWESANLEQSIDDLTASGVSFLRFPPLEQDERGTWHAPGGAAVAWFRDPDGNTLSLSRHA